MSNEVTVTVSADIDRALDKWGEAIRTRRAESGAVERAKHDGDTIAARLEANRIIVEAIRASVLADRESCAEAMDALAEDERKSMDAAAHGSDHYERARAMRKAYERAALTIRTRK